MWTELERALASGAAVVAHGAVPGWAAWLATELAAREPLVVVVAPDDLAARALEADIRFFHGTGHGAPGAPAARRPARSTRSLRCRGSTSRRTPSCRRTGRRSWIASRRCTG